MQEESISVFARTMKSERLRLGLTQKEFGDSIDLTAASINRIEKGISSVTSDVLLRFCKEYNYAISIDKHTEEPLITRVCYHLISSLHTKMGDTYDVTSLKLHKLLYYLEFYSLSKHSQSLIDMPFVATPYGPIASGLEELLKEFITLNQLITFNVTLEPLPFDMQQIVDSFLTTNVAYKSAFELTTQTYMDCNRVNPWSETYLSPSADKTIPREQMKEFALKIF